MIKLASIEGVFTTLKTLYPFLVLTGQCKWTEQKLAGLVSTLSKIGESLQFITEGALIGRYRPSRCGRRGRHSLDATRVHLAIFLNSTSLRIQTSSRRHTYFECSQSGFQRNVKTKSREETSHLSI